ncbi:hypothetical protein RhiJN_00911 [Ceratobasidium sp. AG-Ba]|nr:hypothetical protein RhiJN_00911 [Ceratobasidium sp. AG-Ba]QRW01941.1 hypothetical protein RhiLY_00938 [Ceratobasidium sp. AG-Ba]
MPGGILLYSLTSAKRGHIPVLGHRRVRRARAGHIAARTTLQAVPRHSVDGILQALEAEVVLGVPRVKLSAGWDPTVSLAHPAAHHVPQGHIAAPLQHAHLHNVNPGGMHLRLALAIARCVPLERITIIMGLHPAAVVVPGRSTVLRGKRFVKGAQKYRDRWLPPTSVQPVLSSAMRIAPEILPPYPAAATIAPSLRTGQRALQLPVHSHQEASENAAFLVDAL